MRIISAIFLVFVIVMMLTSSIISEPLSNISYKIIADDIDTDGDGILDDGDYSGVVGDNPCHHHETENCDDNCVDVFNPDQADSDFDQVGNVCDSTCCNTPGDANNNGAVGVILDITYLIAFLYHGGPSPPCMPEADPDGSGAVNLLDIVYLINWVWMGGPEPICGPDPWPEG